MTRDGLTKTPFSTVAWCVTCRTLTSAPVPVRVVRTGCGERRTLWACPSHATELAPGPLPGELDREGEEL